MISGTTKDYTFRKADFSIFPTLASAGVPVLAMVGSPSLITGQSKAAQTFLKILMTPLGHYKADPFYGSELPSLLFSGGLIYPDQLPSMFAMEAARVTERMRTLRPTAPDDEVIERAELSSVSVVPGSVDLQIYLYFRNASTPRKITLPVRLKPV